MDQVYANMNTLQTHNKILNKFLQGSAATQALLQTSCFVNFQKL